MAEIRLTKNELRDQQHRLTQLRKYLPTLQLKKAMLQAEITEARIQITQCQQRFDQLHEHISEYSALLTAKFSIDLGKIAIVKAVHKRYENVAGVELPYFEGVDFEEFSYGLFDTPPWLDEVVSGLRNLAVASAQISVALEKKTALEKEFREVSIRVNLFEKILIPRALRNIKKIKVFLGDQQLAAVSQAKTAKAKIEEHKQLLQNYEMENSCVLT